MRFPRLRLPASGWRRRLAQCGVVLGVLFLLLTLMGFSLWGLFQVPAFQGWFFTRMIELTPPATPEETPGKPGIRPVYAGPVADGHQAKSAADVHGVTNFWNIHLSFTGSEWEGIQYRRVPPVRDWLGPDGQPTLRNPKASRNGLAGVLGFDFPWSAGDVEFGGVVLTNVGIRFKGNGTYLSAVRSYRKSFKLDLDRNVKGQSLAGRTVFNLGNLSADFTCLSDTLGYEFFREAGVPSPRTTFARVFLSIAGVETNRLLGPYLMVENPDAEWAREVFGAPGVALFKPVTMELFSDLGTNWADYKGIYDPKTPVTREQEARVMEMAAFVTHADDEEFGRRIGAYVDLDETARFLACEVLLSNYDGFLSNGQNFLFYLDPRSNRIGFIPWDLDHSWGEFPFVGTADQRERADIWQPWVGSHRFLERLMAVEDFRQRYRAALGALLETRFVPARLDRRVEELGAAMRPLIAEWSTNRLARFDVAVSAVPGVGPRDGKGPMDPDRATWQIRRFVRARFESVRGQLDGAVEGVVLTRRKP